MSVAAPEEFTNDTAAGRPLGIKGHGASIRRRRAVPGMREWISLAATGAIGVWVCAVVTVSVR